MPDKLQVSIIGLGLVGASAGLALRRHSDRIQIVGHDRDPGKAGRAKSAGAVDRTEWNLVNAVRNADRILLALPLNEIRDTLEAVAGDLKAGCVILDTADVKAPVLKWAAELLPSSVTLVGGHPILVAETQDPAAARADLFADKLFCLVPGAGSGDAGVRLAADLVEAIGAKPFFLDAPEHDGLVAAVEHLPAIMAGALMEITSASSGWTDMRKMAGSQFYSSTLLVAEDGQAAITACAANRENIVRWLDLLMAELGDWRERLAAGEDEALVTTFTHGLESGQKWLRAQATGNWEETGPAPEIPDTGSILRGMIGLRRPRAVPEKPKR